MGCDIHGFVETKEIGSWWPFARNIYLSRNYYMFGLLAGVRGEGPPVAEPRGFPLDASYGLKDEFGIHVYEKVCDCGEGRSTTRERADKWLAEGYSFPLNDSKTWISDPDHHTPSWLTRDELQRACERYEAASKTRVGPEWRALLAVMAEFPESRFVFWFDN